jgi:hypothetical protein
MIKGDKVVALEWKAIPNLVGLTGEVKQWREVGIALHVIDYEYLVMFGESGPYIWIPARYLRRL